jgi:transcriptional regulator with XRE-family HTH domain
MGGDPVAGRSLAERLDHLFETVHPAGRGPYTNREVANAINANGGPKISATYVWQLRRGERTNPTIDHLRALASFFGVPTSYFIEDDTHRIDAELELLVALRDAGVRQIALRASGLPPESLEPVRQVIEVMRGVHGLPPHEPSIRDGGS